MGEAAPHGRVLCANLGTLSAPTTDLGWDGIAEADPSVGRVAAPVVAIGQRSQVPRWRSDWVTTWLAALSRVPPVGASAHES